jgi:hypothetical protein
MTVALDGADETVLRFAAALSQVNEAGSAHEFECGLRALVRGLEDARTMASGEPA